jgi:hypothetical protein
VNSYYEAVERINQAASHSKATYLKINPIEIKGFMRDRSSHSSRQQNHMKIVTENVDRDRLPPIAQTKASLNSKYYSNLSHLYGVGEY